MIIDSGCSQICVPNTCNIENVQDANDSHTIMLTDGSVVQPDKIGELKIFLGKSDSLQVSIALCFKESLLFVLSICIANDVSVVFYLSNLEQQLSMEI